MTARTVASAELTDRQREVLEFVACGKTNYEIATELGITLDGAKWHLREIMAKLGCDTREEAVAMWRSRPGRAQRLWDRAGRSLAIFGTGLGKAAAGTALAVLAGVAALGLFLASRGSSQPTGAGGGLSDTKQTADASGAQPVSFRSCGTSTFERPRISAMSEAFHNPRFSGVVGASSATSIERPGPVYFSFYLTNVYQITPRAISANVVAVALSGVQQNGNARTLIAPAVPCGETFRQDYSLAYYELWFVDVVPKAMTLDGPTLTIVADRLLGSFTDVVFPDPAASAPATPTKDVFNGLLPFKDLRVVDAEGDLVYSRSMAGTAQYADDGALLFATNAFGGTQVEFEVRGRPQTIVVFTQDGSNGGGVVNADTGKSVASDVVQRAPDTWREAFRKEMPPGRYRVDGGGGVLVVPAGTPLP